MLQAVKKGIALAITGPAIIISSCAPSPLDRCISAKMDVWDEANPSGVELKKVCADGSALNCWTPKGDGPGYKTESRSRAQEAESVTNLCLIMTKRS